MSKRGRAYACTRCNFTAEKFRVIGHVYKHHLALEQAPFYCTLCLFRCTRKRDLERHIKGFGPHVQRAQELAAGKDDAVFLKESQHPYVLGEADFKRASREDSQEQWSSRERGDEAGPAPEKKDEDALPEQLLSFLTELPEELAGADAISCLFPDALDAVVPVFPLSPSTITTVPSTLPSDISDEHAITAPVISPVDLPVISPPAESEFIPDYEESDAPAISSSSTSTTSSSSCTSSSSSTSSSPTSAQIRDILSELLDEKLAPIHQQMSTNNKIIDSLQTELAIQSKSLDAITHHLHQLTVPPPLPPFPFPSYYQPRRPRHHTTARSRSRSPL